MTDALETFVAVAEAGSFSSVAKSQGVAVSSVSRRIDSLEAELSAKLFNRSSRRLMLTDAGEHFLPRARSIIAEMADARQSLVTLHSDPRGLLTVTAPAMFGRRHVAPAVIDFLRLYPLLEVDLHVGDEIIDLAASRVDVAIRIGSLSDKDLVASRLAPVRRLVCASPAYLERAGRPSEPMDLLQHNCLSVASKPYPLGWWCFAGVNRDAALPVRGNLRSDDTDTLLQAALAGVGVVHLASWLVGDMVAAGRLISLLPDHPPPKKAETAVYAVRMPGRSHTAKAQLFIAHLRKVLGASASGERVHGGR